MSAHNDVFGARTTLETTRGTITYYRLDSLARRGVQALDRLPFTIKILLENVLRHAGSELVNEGDVLSLANWVPGQAAQSDAEYPFLPARVLLQDFTGVPAVADLAAMRSAIARLYGDPQKVNPLVPADLVIDHSVQVDLFGSTLAFARNVEREYERNSERYALLRWGQQAFSNFRVVPPGTGIVHQVNLEYLAPVVMTKQENGEVIAFPDTLVGTDSHMSPEFGATATLFPVDAETLLYLRGTGRSQQLVDLVERYTKAQGLFRTDDMLEPQFDDLLELDLATIEPSLAGPRRPQDRVPMQDLSKVFRTTFADRFKAAAENDVTENSLIRLGTEGGQPDPDPVAQKEDIDRQLARGGGNGHGNGSIKNVLITMGDTQTHITDGSVAIAAITSCTNTSNPSVMVAAGLLAKHAVERGLSVKPTVKTSLAPGSRAVIDYLNNANLLPYLEALRFHLVGFGCTTCHAEGTLVLLANGTARRIEQMPGAGGATLLAPTTDGRLGTTTQAEMMVQGE